MRQRSNIIDKQRRNTWVTAVRLLLAAAKANGPQPCVYANTISRPATGENQR